MSENTDKRDSMSQEEVERYRRQRVEQFRLRIEDEAEKPKAEPVSDFTDEITSFSDETTKAQIERASKKELRRQKKEEKKKKASRTWQNWIAVLLQTVFWKCFLTDMVLFVVKIIFPEKMTYMWRPVKFAVLV